MPFETEPCHIPGLLRIRARVFEDQRGFFLETFKKSDFKAWGIGEDFVQWNHACSRKGVVRGLHYQIHPFSQGKLLRVIKGSIFDVALDIRKGSPWYGKWQAVTLHGESSWMFWIPPGFAHGYMALDDHTEVVYGTTCEYAPGYERGIRWNDPSLAIDWPPLETLLNTRDLSFPPLESADNTFTYGG